MKQCCNHLASRVPSAPVPPVITARMPGCRSRLLWAAKAGAPPSRCCIEASAIVWRTTFKRTYSVKHHRNMTLTQLCPTQHDQLSLSGGCAIFGGFLLSALKIKTPSSKTMNGDVEATILLRLVLMKCHCKCFRSVMMIEFIY
jgi:hypothetical protein